MTTCWVLGRVPGRGTSLGASQWSCPAGCGRCEPVGVALAGVKFGAVCIVSSWGIKVQKLPHCDSLIWKRIPISVIRMVNFS